MRIVGGALGGRRFDGPPGESTRPTSERVREAVASALGARGRLDGAIVLDLYAGTGALAFEALSRGAQRAVLVERDRLVASALEKSIAQLGLGGRARVERLDLHTNGAVERLIERRGAFDLVFADPPYAAIEEAALALDRLVASGGLEEDGLVVLEHARKHPPNKLRSLASVALYEYGDTSITFLSANQDPSAP